MIDLIPQRDYRQIRLAETENVQSFLAKCGIDLLIEMPTEAEKIKIDKISRLVRNYFIDKYICTWIQRNIPLKDCRELPEDFDPETFLRFCLKIWADMNPQIRGIKFNHLVLKAMPDLKIYYSLKSNLFKVFENSSAMSYIEAYRLLTLLGMTAEKMSVLADPLVAKLIRHLLTILSGRLITPLELLLRRPFPLTWLLEDYRKSQTDESLKEVLASKVGDFTILYCKQGFDQIFPIG